MKNPIITQIDISLTDRDYEVWTVTLYEVNLKVYKQNRFKTQAEALAFISGIQFAYNILTGNVLPISQNSY